MFRRTTGLLCGTAVAAFLIVGLTWQVMRSAAAAPVQQKAAAKAGGRAMVWQSGPSRKMVKGESSVTVQASRFYRGAETEQAVWIEPVSPRGKSAEAWLSRDDAKSLLAWYNKAKDVKASRKKAVTTSGSMWACTPAVPFGFTNPEAQQWDEVTVAMEFGKGTTISFSRVDNYRDTFTTALGQEFFDALADALKDLTALEAVESPLNVK